MRRDRGRRESEKRVAAVGVVANDDVGQDEMKEANHEVRDAEQHGVVAKGARHSEGDAEHRSHRREHREPHPALVDVHRTRQPRIELHAHQSAARTSIPRKTHPMSDRRRA